MTEFTFPKFKHEYSLSPDAIAAGKIVPAPMCVEWAEKHWRLTNIYSLPGRFIAKSWQRWILDLVCYWKKIYLIAPVRTGKTMIASIWRNYCIDVYHMGGMVVFPRKEDSQDNFKLRIIPEIKEIPAMRKHWTGKDDDLTITNMVLKDSLWKIGSAANKNDLAGWGYQFIHGDEVSKWRPVNYDPDLLLEGRQKDYVASGNYRKVYCSSPWEVGDEFYKVVYRPGVLIVTARAKCIHCKEWFEWSDHDIKENIEKDSKLRKDPNRIKGLKEKAVRYECPNCHKEIPEEARLSMIENTVFAAPKIELKNFFQPGETILSDGTVTGMDRSKYEAIAVNWNRLIDHTYKFYECLASFFESLRSPEKRRAHETEDMARFYKVDSKRKGVEYLMSKKGEYYQYGPDAIVPDGVLVVTCCMDSQDNGFYYVIRGWGRNLETWLLRHDFIDVQMDDKATNKEEVLAKVRENIEKPLKRKDGSRVHIHWGLIDRGGHRSGYVDYLVAHIHWLYCYVGLTQIDFKKELIYESENKSVSKLYVGQTQQLSKKVEEKMGLQNWHLPADVGEEYLEQVRGQFWVDEEDDYGKKKTKFITTPNDHYRDCENYTEGAVLVIGLEDMLTNDDGVRYLTDALKNYRAEEKPPQPEPEKRAPPAGPHRPDRPEGGEKKRWLSLVTNRRR